MTISQETKVDLWWLAWAIPSGLLISAFGIIYAVACWGGVQVAKGAFELEDDWDE